MERPLHTLATRSASPSTRGRRVSRCRSGCLLLGLASFAADLNGRVGRLWQAMAAAAQGDPEIASAHAGLQERIRTDFLKVAGLLQQRGGLRSDVPLEEVALTLWLLTSPYQHEHLVVQAGWTPQRYLAWLQRVVLEAALAPGK